MDSVAPVIMPLEGVSIYFQVCKFTYGQSLVRVVNTLFVPEISSNWLSVTRMVKVGNRVWIYSQGLVVNSNDEKLLATASEYQ